MNYECRSTNCQLILQIVKNTTFLRDDPADRIGYSIFSAYHFPFSPYFCVMTTTPFLFKVLFCFENATQLIVEIKRTDIQSDDKSVIYKWIIIRKEIRSSVQSRLNAAISALTFQSMTKNGDEQIRGFAEGTLEWDGITAHFNGEPMTQIETGDLSGESLELISNFLGTN